MESLVGYSRKNLNEKSGIYIIENGISEKVYVGSSKNLYARWSDHKSRLNSNKHPNKHLQRSWNKYGQDAFTYKVIEFIDYGSDLIDRESYWIERLKACDKEIGYNILKKGNLKGFKHSEETKKKLSRLGKGKKRSKETRERISEAQRGLKKKRTKPMTEEHKRKIGDAHIGMKRSRDAIKNMSIPIIQMSKDGRFIKEWIGASEAGRELGLDISTITKCCKGKLSHHKGYRWMYKRDYIGVVE